MAYQQNLANNQASSISFGSDGPAPSRTAQYNKKGDTCANVLGDVPSVKLHAPPGGSSSISFGSDPAPAPVSQGRPNPQASSWSPYGGDSAQQAPPAAAPAAYAPPPAPAAYAPPPAAAPQDFGGGFGG